MAATVMFAWCTIVIVAIIRELGDLAGGSGPSEISSFSPVRPAFLDYVFTIGGGVTLCATVTAILFVTAYLLMALGLIAEVAVFDLDETFGAEDDAELLEDPAPLG